MPMKLTQRSKAGIAIGVIFIAFTTTVLFQQDPDHHAPVEPTLVAHGPAQQSMSPPPQDIRDLAGRLGAGGILSPTPAQQAEERRVTAEQVSAALRWLVSHDERKRLEGAEQLGAYPTPEAGKALVNSLLKDPSPAVRVAAATSLANFQEPGATAIKGLISALRDKSEDVRHAALGTLAIYLETLDSDSARHRQITAALGTLAKSPNMDPATRKTLSDLLSKH